MKPSGPAPRLQPAWLCQLETLRFHPNQACPPPGPLAGRGVVSTAALPPPWSQSLNFLTFVPYFALLSEMFGRPPPTRGPLLRPHPPKAILVMLQKVGVLPPPPPPPPSCSLKAASTLQLHVLGKPNQRQTLNSSCSRPIKTLLRCLLPLLKSDILVINKSERQGKALASFF